MLNAMLCRVFSTWLLHSTAPASSRRSRRRSRRRCTLGASTRLRGGLCRHDDCAQQRAGAGGGGGGAGGGFRGAEQPARCRPHSWRRICCSCALTYPCNGSNPGVQRGRGSALPVLAPPLALLSLCSLPLSLTNHSVFRCSESSLNSSILAFLGSCFRSRRHFQLGQVLRR